MNDAPPPSDPSRPTREVSPLLKLAIEAGPLAVFFIANARVDIFFATKAFMLAIVLSLAGSWHLEHRLPIMPLVTAVVVLIFGGLTIYLDDELFIQLKPTIVNSLFAGVLLGGLAFGRSLLKPLLGAALELTAEGWRVLTLRWGLFFIVLALLNEIVRRTLSTDAWVNFKVFGIMPLTVVFAMSQVGLLERHKLQPDEGGADGG